MNTVNPQDSYDIPRKAGKIVRRRRRLNAMPVIPYWCEETETMYEFANTEWSRNFIKKFSAFRNGEDVEQKEERTPERVKTQALAVIHCAGEALFSENENVNLDDLVASLKSFTKVMETFSERYKNAL